MLNNSQDESKKNQSLAKFVLFGEFVIGLSFIISATIIYYSFIFYPLSLSKGWYDNELSDPIIEFRNFLWFSILAIVIIVIIISILNFKKISKIKNEKKYGNVSYIFIKSGCLILPFLPIIWIISFPSIFSLSGSHTPTIILMTIPPFLLSILFIFFGLGLTFILSGNSVLFYEKLNKNFKVIFFILSLIPYISFLYIALKFDIIEISVFVLTLEKLFSNMAFSFFIGTLICGLAIILHSVLLYTNVKKIAIPKIPS